MATQTFPFGSYGDAVRAEIDVNDANWRPSRVRCLNTSAYPLVATVYQAGTLVLTVTAPANQTSQWNISGRSSAGIASMAASCWAITPCLPGGRHE